MTILCGSLSLALPWLLESPPSRYQFRHLRNNQLVGVVNIPQLIGQYGTFSVLCSICVYCWWSPWKGLRNKWISSLPSLSRSLPPSLSPSLPPSLSPSLPPSLPLFLSSVILVHAHTHLTVATKNRKKKIPIIFVRNHTHPPHPSLVKRGPQGEHKSHHFSDGRLMQADINQR